MIRSVEVHFVIGVYSYIFSNLFYFLVPGIYGMNLPIGNYQFIIAHVEWSI